MNINLTFFEPAATEIRRLFSFMFDGSNGLSTFLGFLQGNGRFQVLQFSLSIRVVRKGMGSTKLDEPSQTTKYN